MLERDSDRGRVQEGRIFTGSNGRRPPEHPDELAVLVQHPDVRQERIVRGGPGIPHGGVADAGQRGAGLRHVHLELMLVAFERDVGREIQAFREDFDLVAGRNEDVVTVSRIELDVLSGAKSVGDRRGLRRRRRPRDGQHQSQDEKEIHLELLSTA